MSNISHGGCYVEKDDTIKISAEAYKKDKDYARLITFDDIKIEGLDGAKIQGIELHAMAGDIPTLTIHYYVDNGNPDGGYRILEETIHLKNFSIQSSSRMTHVEYEKKRKEILGIK